MFWPRDSKTKARLPSGVSIVTIHFRSFNMKMVGLFPLFLETVRIGNTGITSKIILEMWE
jgi:hypothetical protein